MSFTSRLRSVFSLAEKSPKADLTEYGSDSVSYAVSGGSRRLTETERQWDLRGRQGSRTYRSMRLDDSHIRGLRRAQNLPLVQATAQIDPADPDDPDAVAKADLVREVLIDDYPWRSFVSDTMLALDYGFAPFEIIWYRDQASGYLRCYLELRPTSSIAVEDIHINNGGIDHVVQRPIDGGERTIPGEKLVWFCHDKEGASFQGTPILRSMYRPWKIKRDLEMDLPSAVRRLAGIPDITYTGTLPTEAKRTLEEIGERIGLSADGFSLHGDNVSVQLLTGNANVGDILEAIRYCNRELSATCQAQVFDLGTTTGSWALGKTLNDLFANGVQAEAKYREDVLNASGGVIHQLVAYNFPRDDNRPTLRFGHVQAVDMRSFAQGLLWMGQAFQQLPEDLQDWARAELNAPEGPPVAQLVQPRLELPQPAGAEFEPAARASECGCAHGLRLAEDRELRRAPRGAERYVALAEVDRRFTDAKQAVREATQATRDKLIAELSRRAMAAQEAGKLAHFAAGQPPMVDKLSAEVRAVLTEFYRAGREQVSDELERQERGEPVYEPPLEERQTIAAAEKPPRKLRRAVAAALPDPEDAIEVEAGTIARSIAGATLAAAAHAAARVAAGVPLDPGSFTEAVTRDSDGAALRFGAVVSDMMQLGRATEANERASDIAYGQVSAILDANTCPVCEAADGFQSEDLGEVDALAPNPDCEGGANCRCLPIFILRGVEEAA